MDSMASMPGMTGMTMSDDAATQTTMSSMSTMATATTSAMTGAMTTAAGGMTMDGCRISMLWNWYTIDTCFLSSTWRIRSGGGFAALCIGIVLMGILLQALGWLSKFYDQRLVQQAQKAAVVAGTSDSLIAKNGRHISSPTTFRPNVTQQAVRALIRTMHFAMAYWIMLLVMYYNGYVIICVILGSFIGIYFFHWDRLGGTNCSTPEAQTEPTGCCG